MDPPCPPHWTFAARAAYFGESMCPFCDHRNPAGAKFCNDCAWPLHLKPCSRCNAVNNQAAVHCYNCCAEWPEPPGKSNATPDVQSARVVASRATTEHVAVTDVATQPVRTDNEPPNIWRSLRPLPILSAAIATVLIAGAYTTHQRIATTPSAVDVAQGWITAGERNVPDTRPVVPLGARPNPVEPEITAVLPAPNDIDAQIAADRNDTSALRELALSGDDADPSEGASARRVPVPATQRAGAQQREEPQPRTPGGGVTRTTRAHASTPVHVPVAQARNERRPDRWQMMETRLDSCSGDFLARFVCDQRVRLRFCEGHWGKVPQCASGVVNEHGQ